MVHGNHLRMRYTKSILMLRITQMQEQEVGELLYEIEMERCWLPGLEVSTTSSVPAKTIHITFKIYTKSVILARIKCYSH
jgi:hypothetical protein